MSVTTTRYIWGVKIYATEAGLVQDTDIGLYVAAGVGTFRWAQYPVTASDTWKAGLINIDGVGDIGASVDLALGGNVAKIDGTEISVTNIIGTSSMWKKLADAGISLAGCKCEIVEFNTAASPATQTILYRGVVESAPAWDIESYRIRISEPYFKRDTLIGALIDNSTGGNYEDADINAAGEIIPVVFGNFVPLYNSDGKLINSGLVKALRTTTREIEYNASKDVTSFTGMVETDATTYEVVDRNTSTYLGITISIGSITSSDLAALKTKLIGKYIKVAQAISSVNDGAYRLIDDVVSITQIPATDAPYYTAYTKIAITFTKRFRKNLEERSGTTYGDSVKIVDISQQYAIDSLGCYGLQIVDGEYQYYGYDNGFYRIPKEAFIITAGTGNTKLSTNLEQTNGDPFGIDSATILPVVSPGAYTEDDMRLYFGYTLGRTYRKKYPGIYAEEYDAGGTPTNWQRLVKTGGYYVVNASDYVIDADGSTNLQISYTGDANVGGIGGNVLAAVSFKLPEYPTNYDATKVYLLIKHRMIESEILGGLLGVQTLAVYRRRQLAGIYDRLWYKNDFSLIATATSGVRVDNMPTFYATNVQAKDEYYYVQNDSTILKSGYDLIDLGIEDRGEYAFARELLLGSITTFQVGSQSTVNNYLYELAIMFQKTIDISSEIYLPFKGRIYNDTWGARKPAANLMESPVDILEHINRLQNWTEEGATEAPGNAYAAAALINTATTEGGFDYIGLDNMRTFTAARQILDEGDARSGAIKESLCKQFFLCSYTNPSGQECVNTIHRRDSAPVTSITLSHIIADSLGAFEEMDVADIFCEPFVRYAYNSATDKYDGIIRITRSDAATYSAAYISGYSGTEGETIWNKAHALYSHYRIVTEPPADMTDCNWIRTEADAEAYLDMWLQWMGVYLSTTNVATVARKRRFSFDVPYSVAMTIDSAHSPWFPSMRFSITLPHQTAGVSLQCIVEEIRFNVSTNTATVTAICYDVAEDIQFYVQNSYNSYATVGWDDWQNSLLTKAEAPTQSNDVQNAD